MWRGKMTNYGEIRNGPLTGRWVMGKARQYDIGGASGVHLGGVEDHIGQLVWHPEQGGFWEWRDRDLMPIEEGR